VYALFKEYANMLLKNGFIQYLQYACYFAVEKEKIELAAYIACKKSIPIYKRLIRGIILRAISMFKINAEYYIH
jgi:hypothetical protein